MWKCVECDKRFRYEEQAERAADEGCPRCGSDFGIEPCHDSRGRKTLEVSHEELLETVTKQARLLYLQEG